MKIPIYHFKSKCWKCKKEIKIYYPARFAYKHNLGNIQKVFSKTMGSETIGNICNHCNSYQGNWFLDEHLMEAIYEPNFLNKLIWIDSPIKCEECNNIVDYDIDKDESTIFEFFNGYYGNLCLSCMNYQKVEELIEEINNSSVCTVCNKNILNTNFEDFPGYIINDKNIIFSKSHEHHISYAKDETITVCDHCHMKIHNSDDPEYIKFKPIDKRTDKRKHKLVPCSKCTGKAKVLISELENNKNPLCYKCKNKPLTQREIALNLYKKGIIDQSELEVTYAEYPEKDT